MNQESRNLAERAEKAKGIFTLTFTKKDGSTRVMNCRMGVTKHLKGGKSLLDPKQYLTVFDMQKGEYRAVNRDTITDIKGA